MTVLDQPVPGVSSSNVLDVLIEAANIQNVISHGLRARQLTSHGQPSTSSLPSEEERNKILFKALSQVTHLRLNNRGLAKLEKLCFCPNVRVMYAFKNRLTSIDDLASSCKLLEEGYFHDNLISRIPDNFGSSLRHLKKLFLGFNKVSLVSGLASPCLEELYLPHQQIDKELLFDFSVLKCLSQSLKILDISGNRISSLAPFSSTLTALRVFHASNNEIEHLTEVTALVSRNPCLLSVHLNNNPVSLGSFNFHAYRDAVVLFSSAIEDVDGKPVTAEERTFVKQREKRSRGETKSKNINSHGI